MKKLNTQRRRPAASVAAADPTPGHSEKFARTNNRLTVRDYLPRAAHDGSAAAGKCEWSSHVAASLTPEEAGALAWVLIDTIMRARFGPATQLHETWFYAINLGRWGRIRAGW